MCPSSQVPFALGDWLAGKGTKYPLGEPLTEGMNAERRKLSDGWLGLKGEPWRLEKVRKDSSEAFQVTGVEPTEALIAAFMSFYIV